MKYFFAFLSLLFLTSRLSAQCNHRHGFAHSAAADSVDAIHYIIHLQAIDFTAKTIQAETMVRLRPKLALNTIPLELKALQVSAVFMDQQPLSFSQSGDMLHIMTGQTFHPDDTLEVSIHYSGQPFHESWGGFHFSGNYAFNLGVGFESDPHNLGKAWFPCIDDFQDRATYEVLITLPEQMTGIAGGVLVDTTHHANGSITWHWNLAQPVPTYLASAAAGTYALSASTFIGMQQNIPITIYTRPMDSLKVAGSFANLLQIAGIFENRFGAYPFDRIGYTGTAIGAMEHVCNISYPNSAISGNLASEYLLTHELSHMWFGNLVTCADAGDMWLNEGWATFCQYFFKHDLYSPDIYRNEMNANHFDILKNAHIVDGSYLALKNVPTNYTYGTTVYDKGATVVHTLMNYLGQEVFFDAVKAYLQTYAYQHASSENLRDFLTNHTGLDMGPFFDTWVFTPGTPHFSIDSIHTTAENGIYATSVHLKQKHKGYNHISTNNILEITFIGAGWQLHTDTVHFSGQTGVSTKQLDFEPLFAMADFYDKTADATTDVSGVIRSTGELSLPTLNTKIFVDALTDTAFYRMTHHWAAPDSLKTAVSGLRLSPYRHWEFRGIFPQNTMMRGRFFYANSSTLDGSLILSEQDSVVVLYRENPAADWAMVPQTREGLWNIGYIVIHDFKPGQYMLAVWDKQLVGTADLQLQPNKRLLTIEPNPVTEEMAIKWNDTQDGFLSIIDSTGKIIFQQAVWQAGSLVVDARNWAKGWYFAEFRNKNDQMLGYQKIIKQ